MSSEKQTVTYADAGVNLAAWADTKNRIGKLVKNTYNERVVGKFGQFGGMFDVSFLKNYRKPILVSSVDGVGTKLKIAVETGVHDTVGADIVNHCIDDILVMGAKPLFFLDYFATGKLSPDVMESFMIGLTKACVDSGIVLIGGETAEMPGVYHGGDYDIAGTIVGIVEEDEVIDGSTIVKGDTLIGLRSNGLHTNGYSLARKIVTEVARKSYFDIFEPTGRTFGQELLRPHRSYAPVNVLMRKNLIKGCAHITGGGFQENIDRILPDNCNAHIETKRWTPDPIFTFLREQGNVPADDIYRTLNMGIGMVLAVDPKNADTVLASPELAAFEPVVIGRIEDGNSTVVMEW